MVTRQQDVPLNTALGRETTLPRFVPSVYQVALIAVLGAILTLALAPRIEGDFWWHLLAGQYMATDHVIPTHDFLSFTANGHAWLDHEWLTELAMYGLYRVAGYWGPIAFFAVIITATFGLVYMQMAERSVNRLLSLFVLMAGAVASFASWGPRVEMMTLFFLAVYGLLLYRFQVSRDRRLLFVLPPLMLLWTNLHGGFALGLALLAATLLGETFNAVTRHPDALSRIDLRALAFAGLASLVASVMNPNGVGNLLYPLTMVLPNAYNNQIQEWASPNFHITVFMVFEAMLLLLIAAGFVAHQRLNWTHLLLILGFTHLALSQERNVPVWAVVITPLLGVYLAASGSALRDYFPHLKYRRRPVRGGLAPVLNVTLLVQAVCLYAAVAVHYVTPTAPAEDERQNFPTQAIAYMQRHHLPPRVFASYSWGGYLLWKLYPRYRDFIDGRANTVFTSRILSDFEDAYGAGPGYRAVLDNYGVQDVLIERGAPLSQALATDPTWRLTYHDDRAVIYTRRIR